MTDRLNIDELEWVVAELSEINPGSVWVGVARRRLADVRRAADELAGVARARLDGLHGALDSSRHAPPACWPCGWCHTQASPGAVVLQRR